MLNRTLRVLNVEDSVRDVALLTRHLKVAGYDAVCERVETADAMKAALKDREWDVILCDYSMPRFNAINALKLLRRSGLDIPFIIISGTVGEEVAVKAMLTGADDYLPKDNLTRLVPAIERELQEADNRRTQRQTEEERRLIEERYRALFEYAPDGIIIANPESYYLDANAGMCRMLGYDHEELIGMHASDIVANAEVKHIDEALDEIKAASDYHREWEFRRKDGSIFNGDVMVTTMPDGNLMAIIRDITDREAANAALNESNEKFRQLAANVTDVFYMTSPDLSQMLYVSPAYEKIWGRSTDSLYADPYQWGEAILPDERATVIETFAGLAADVPEVSAEFRIARPDGTIRWILSRGFRVLDDDGKVIRITGIASDITEQKDVEAALAESEASFRSLFETANDAILVVDEGTFLACNRAAEKLFGCGKEDILGCSPDTFSPLEQPDGQLSSEKSGKYLEAAMSGVPQFFKWKHNRRDGTPFDAEVSLNRVNFSGAAHVQGTVRDITERTELEEQLRQSQKMEAVGELAGGIAHDFNNLLTAINGYSDLTLKKMSADDPLRHNVKEVREAGHRAAELTAQLLAFSRKQVLKPRVYNLNAAITEIERMLRRIMRESIELRTVLDPDLGNIKADTGQIEQVIMNLAVNARDAMPDGGTLTIETKNVHLDDAYVSQHLMISPGRFVRMTVTDTGNGMDEEIQRHIFEPFFTTKDVGKGTGLGLSTVHGIIKQSGGDIMVYSEVGHGTTFKVYLPCVDQPVEKPRWVGDNIEKCSGTETILLVEDEEIVRNLVREVLIDNGYTVLEAANGKSALSVCDTYTEPIHMLLTDVVMPRMSGNELRDLVIKSRPEIKVLFMSGYTDDAMAHWGIFASDTEFIEKPFTPDGLARKVREVLEY